MKVGRKKGGGGIQQFFVDHVEKIGFGLAAVLIVVCGVLAVQTETYDGTPDQLVQLARSKDTAIRNNNAAAALNEVPQLVKWEEAVKASDVALKTNQSGLGIGGGNERYVIYNKRGMPELLPATDVGVVFLPVCLAERGEGMKAGDEGVAGLAANDGDRNEGVGDGDGDDDDDDTIGGGVRPGVAPSAAGPIPGQVGEGGGDNDLEQFPGAASGGEGELGYDASSFERRAGVEPPAGSVAKGHLLVVVTARVPMKKQYLKYMQTYEQSRKRDARLDVPQYVTFLVLRQDVTDGEGGPWYGGSGSTLIKENLDLTDKWATEYPEIANPRRVVRLTKYSPLKLPFQGLTWPLPPLLDQDFGDEVAGPFERYIKPLEEPTDEPGDTENPFDFGAPGEPPPEAAPPDEAAPSGPAPEASLPPADPGLGQHSLTGPRFYASGGRGGSGGSPPGLPPGYPGPGGGKSGLPPDYPTGPPSVPPGYGPGSQPGEGSGDEMLPGEMFPGDGMDGPMDGMDGMAGVVGDDVSGEPYPDLLLRFCDFTVEEGHRYRYKVRLVMLNPNHGIAKHHLEDRESGNEQFLPTDWSTPSDVVSVSGHSEILAGPASPAIGALNPSVKLIVRQRDRETGANVSHEFTKVERGQLLNFAFKSSRKDKLLMADPITKRAVELDEFNFKSDELLVDLSGGQQLPGRGYHKAPGESLLMDSRGWLVVKSELSDDASSYHAELKRLEGLKPVEYEPADVGDAGQVGEGEDFNPFENFGPGGGKGKRGARSQGDDLPPGYPRGRPSIPGGGYGPRGRRGRQPDS